MVSAVSDGVETGGGLVREGLACVAWREDFPNFFHSI